MIFMGAIGRFRSWFRKPRTDFSAVNSSNTSVAYSNNGQMRFVFGGQGFKITLKEMSDRKVTAIKTGDIITLIGDNGKILKEVNVNRMGWREKSSH